MRFKVSLWGFSCLDYHLDILISWIHNLSLYNWFCLHFLYLIPHCMLVCVCAHDTFFDICFFDSDLSIHVYLPVHAIGFILRTHWVVFWQSLHLYIRIPELWCSGPSRGASLYSGSVVDQRMIVRSSFLPASFCLALEIPSCCSWASPSFCTL